MKHNIYIYILIMAAVSYTIRVLPLTLIRKKITNRFLNSLLYYLPYVTLAVMTFPAILEVTENPVHGLVGLLVGGAFAWFTSNLFGSAVCTCAAVFIMGLLF